MHKRALDAGQCVRTSERLLRRRKDKCDGHSGKATTAAAAPILAAEALRPAQHMPAMLAPTPTVCWGMPCQSPPDQPGPMQAGPVLGVPTFPHGGMKGFPFPSAMPPFMQHLHPPQQMLMMQQQLMMMQQQMGHYMASMGAHTYSMPSGYPSYGPMGMPSLAQPGMAAATIPLNGLPPLIPPATTKFQQAAGQPATAVGKATSRDESRRSCSSATTAVGDSGQSNAATEECLTDVEFATFIDSFLISSGTGEASLLTPTGDSALDLQLDLGDLFKSDLDTPSMTVPEDPGCALDVALESTVAVGLLV